MGKTRYRQAPEVQEIAEGLIEEFHPHLLGQRFEYLFRSAAAKSKGRVVLGSARVVSGLNAFLARSNQLLVLADSGKVVSAGGMDLERAVEPASFFVIEIAADMWGTDDELGNRLGLSDAQCVALVDHEFCHCQVNAAGVPVLVHHDVEEFGQVVERHGLWKPDLAWFARQTSGARVLPFDGWTAPEAGA